MSIIRRFLPEFVNKKIMYAIGKLDSTYHRYYLPEKFDGNEVYPGVYIGNLLSSMDFESMTTFGITHVMSVMNGSISWNNPNIKYSIYHVNDDSWIDLSQHFDSAIGFIDNAINNGGKVLVHCKEGVSRSVTMVIAYIIYKEKITPSAALEMIRKIRSKANPNKGFMRLLQQYYDKITTNTTNTTNTTESYSSNSSNSSNYQNCNK
jgi:hypothetical protein